MPLFARVEESDGQVYFYLLEGTIESPYSGEVVEMAYTPKTPTAIVHLVDWVKSQGRDLSEAYVKMPHGEWEQPDALTLAEALECTLS